MSQTLLVIDVQNDYFPGGAFPLWNTEAVLANLERAVARAVAQGVPVVFIQHLSPARPGEPGSFVAGTPGAEIHPRLRALAPHAPVVAKAFADSFHQTDLEPTLERLGTNELLVTGMMTQNCVTHTAISKAAEKYQVTILPDCCATVSEVLHQIALRAVELRVPLVPSTEAL